MVDYLDWHEREHAGSRAVAEFSECSMPFGRYKDVYILDLPEAYLTGGNSRAGLSALPRLATAYEIRINGLDAIMTPFRQEQRRRRW